MKRMLPERFFIAGLFAAVLLLCMAATATLSAQSPTAEKEPASNTSAQGGQAKATVSPEQRLAIEQRRIATKYEHLEQVLLRMAELSVASDPRRAALLRRTVAESKERMVGVQFDRMAELLDTLKLSRAIENQKDLDRDLHVLLELLQSENRAKQLASEKARIRAQIKQLGQIIRKEKGIQGRTAGGGDMQRLSGEQKSLSKKTGQLAKEIKEHDQSSESNDQKDTPPKESKKSSPDESEKDEKHDGEPKPNDSRPEDKNSDGEQGGEKKDGQQSGGQQSQQGQKGQSDGQKQSSPNKQKSNPVQKRLEAAKKKMNDAREKLDKAQREGAVEDQEQAIRELEQAKAELEEILRQLREEEIERMLTFLEARFTKMLDMQRTVYKKTQRLDKIPPKQRRHEHEIEAGRLSQDQSMIVLEADRALALLREDGSSIAFPEAVTQMRDDMRQVVLRLARAKVGKITQTIEEAIIIALEEMIDSLQKALEEQEARRFQPPPPRGQPMDPPLVDELSELKMIRALQMRVNRRTQRYSKLIDGEQAENADLLEALRRLAGYQQRIFQITRDLEMGKNK